MYSESRECYHTFSTPEATKAVDVYLEYRKRYGEKLKPKSPDTPPFDGWLSDKLLYSDGTIVKTILDSYLVCIQIVE